MVDSGICVYLEKGVTQISKDQLIELIWVVNKDTLLELWDRIVNHEPENNLNQETSATDTDLKEKQRADTVSIHNF